MNLIVTIIFTFGIVSAPFELKAENQTSKVTRFPVVAATVCVTALLGFGGLGVYKLKNAYTARHAAKLEAITESKLIESQKRNLDEKVVRKLTSMDKKDRKALQEKAFSESKTFLEYISKISAELNFPEQVAAALLQQASDLLGEAKRDPQTYKPSKLFIANKLFIYSVKLTALRAQTNESIRESSEFLQQAFAQEVLNFLWIDSDPEASELLVVEAKKQGAEKGLKIASNSAKSLAIKTKAKLLLASEQTVKKLVP